MINKNKLSFTLAMPLLMAMAAYFTACNPKPGGEEIKNAGTLKEGRWRGLLHTQGKELPFLFDVEQSGDDYLIYLINAAERIPLDEATFTGDSLHLPMYIFDATLHARLDGNHLEGLWVKNYTDDYRVPFSASHGDSARFTLTSGLQPASFGGKWEVDFISENKIEKALGVFDQQGSYLTGTFLTSTGDYRFLEGVVNGSSMKLSTFDGTHAYLFEGEMNEQGEIAGQFWSGKSWHQRWTAKKNANFELPDPYTLTTVKDRDEVFEINFPDNNGEMVSLSDDKYKGKVVVVQIMGTWRPNCMDETRFFANWKGRNQNKELAFVGLAFEMKDDPEYANGRIEKMKNKLGVDYDILLAGSTNELSKARALPMLNSIKSYPTTIFLDKAHKVRKIHTGFSGPGTGLYYDKYVEEFELIIEKLLAE